MGFDPISAVADLINKGLDKFIGDKMPEKDREELKSNMEMFTANEARAENSSFRQFVIEYEGAAKDMPKPIQYLRTMIRPLFTILVGYLDFLYFTSTQFSPEHANILKSINFIVLGFWFGERAITNSGIIDKWIARKEG